MKTSTLTTTLFTLGLALALAAPVAHAQAPVRDDDINGDPLQAKDELAAGDKVIVPRKNYRLTNVVDVIESLPRFSKLTDLLEVSGVGAILREEKAITLFAPTDAAFENLTDEEFAAMKTEENREELVRMLGFHVADSRLESELLTDPVTVDTLAKGYSLDVSTRVDDGDVVILVGGLAKVVAPDIETANAVVHATDRVLFPGRNRAEP